MDLSLSDGGQAREHHRFLSLAHPQFQGGETLSGQSPEGSERLGNAPHNQHRQSASLWPAISELKAEGRCSEETEHRQVKYLNNIVEADHGKLKHLIRLVRGFKTLKSAYATIKGFEVMRALRKGQVGIFVSQTMFSMRHALSNELSALVHVPWQRQ